MSWFNHAIAWQIYPLGFVGAEIRDVQHNERNLVHAFSHLERWLDYAVELGASAVLLGPIFASETHGYDTVNHYQIDPRLGDENDFMHFIDCAKQRGLRIVLDGVFNHVGKAHPAFRAACERGPSSPEAEMFRLTWPRDWKPGDEPEYRNFEGHNGLVALEHQSDAVRAYVIDVMKHWLAKGIDGWRLDAAYAVPTEFWSATLGAVRKEFPSVWFMGEVIHGDYVHIAQNAQFNSITQYELWKACWSSLVDRNFFELSSALERHSTFMKSFMPLTFVGNHDVSRISSVVGQQQAILALVVICTVGGIPCIYYGDEQGYAGMKYERVGGDDEVRPRFPDSPSQLAEWGTWVYRRHQQLIAVRRRNAWTFHARTRIVELENTRFVYEVVSPESTQSLKVTLDVTRDIHASIFQGTKEEFMFTCANEE